MERQASTGLLGREFATDSINLQRLEDVTFLDAVVDCDETSLSNLGEVSTCMNSFASAQ